MKWHKFVTLMAKVVIFSLKRVAALHESTILCSAAILPVMLSPLPVPVQVVI